MQYGVTGLGKLKRTLGLVGPTLVCPHAAGRHWPGQAEAYPTWLVGQTLVCPHVQVITGLDKLKLTLHGL